jgi:hypothetical protein
MKKSTFAFLALFALVLSLGGCVWYGPGYGPGWHGGYGGSGWHDNGGGWNGGGNAWHGNGDWH